MSSCSTRATCASRGRTNRQRRQRRAVRAGRGPDRESADALGALLGTLAEDWRERQTAPRMSEHSARAVHRLMHDLIRELASQSPGPLPADYESPVKRRNVTDHSL